MPKDRSLVHRLFEAGVFLKGLHGVVELVGAGIIYIISGTTIFNVLTSIVGSELVEDPNDFLANLILQHAHISSQGKDFATLYLFVAALANITIAIGLLLHRKHFFPIAGVIMTAFLSYELYLFGRLHSPFVFGLIIYDLVVLYLVYAEYRRRWPALPSPNTAI